MRLLQHLKCSNLIFDLVKRMKILICDDEVVYLRQLESHVKEYMRNRYIDCEIISETEPKNILKSSTCFDLAFLDIQMSVDGITLARELKRRNSKIALFFVTNYNEYQDDAMDLRAFRYFEKPFNVTRLYSGLDKAMEYIDGAYVDLFLYTDGAQKRVLADDIMYITRENRRVVIHTKKEVFPVKGSFDEWCERLPVIYFYQVHKSYLVNLHYVSSYSYSELRLTDNTRIPIAPRKQASFHKFWFEYLRRR